MELRTVVRQLASVDRSMCWPAAPAPREWLEFELQLKKRGFSEMLPRELRRLRSHWLNDQELIEMALCLLESPVSAFTDLQTTAA